MPYYRGVYFKELPFDVVNEKRAARMAVNDSFNGIRMESGGVSDLKETHEVHAESETLELEESIDTVDYSKISPISDNGMSADDVPTPSPKKSKKKTKL